MNKDYKKIIKIILLVTLFLFIIIYSFFEAKKIILGVKIKDVNIINYQTVTLNPLEIKGNAKNAVYIELNGREITIDKDGNWNETILLLPGYNIINIEAKDKFDNYDKKNYQLYFKEDQFNY